MIDLIVRLFRAGSERLRLETMPVVRVALETERITECKHALTDFKVPRVAQSDWK